MSHPVLLAVFSFLFDSHEKCEYVMISVRRARRLPICDKDFNVAIFSPKGRPGISDVSPLSGISGLSFDSALLSPVLFFCLVLLPFLPYLFLNFFQKILQYFSLRDRLFCMAPV